MARQALHEADGLRIVVVDGKLVPHLSDTSALPQGVYLGEAADAPDHVASTLVGSILFICIYLLELDAGLYALSALLRPGLLCCSWIYCAAAGQIAVCSVL